jgi:hypothetical protein
MDISRQVLPPLLLGVSAGYFQRAVVGESKVIVAQMEKHNASVMVAIYGTPWTIPLRNNNSN